MASPFDFVKSINETKENLFETRGYKENDYAKFLINRNFSYYEDTIMIANEANRMLDTVPSKAHFEFYNYLVPRRKRFSKWAKPKVSDDVKVIQEAFDFNTSKAIDALTVLSDEILSELKEELDSKGGRY